MRKSWRSGDREAFLIMICYPVGLRKNSPRGQGLGKESACPEGTGRALRILEHHLLRDVEGPFVIFGMKDGHLLGGGEARRQAALSSMQDRMLRVSRESQMMAMEQTRKAMPLMAESLAQMAERVSTMNNAANKATYGDICIHVYEALGQDTRELVDAIGARPNDAIARGVAVFA